MTLSEQIGVKHEELPVLPFLRNSERLAFNNCQAQWNWAWNMGLIPAMPGSNSRWFGSCIHLALAEWYTPPGGKNGFARGRPLLETWEEVMGNTFTAIATQSDFDDDGEKKFVDAKELGAAMLTGYQKEHGTDPHWEVLVPEQRFNAMIPYNKRQLSDPLIAALGRKNIVKLVGSMDLPVRNHDSNGHVEIVDHKTIGRKTNTDYLSKDNQIGTYISVTAPYLRAIGLMKEREEVIAVVFNFLKKSMPQDDLVKDDQGRVRNKPQKIHHIAAIMELDVESATAVEALGDVGDDRVGLIRDLKKLPLPKLEARSNALGLTVFGDVSKKQPGPLFWREAIPRTRANRQRQVERIADEAEVMARVRSGELPILKSPGEHCNWCDFKDLCDVDENGDDVEGFIKNVFKTQDPYADHRPNAVNSKEGAAAKKETGVW